MISPARAQAFTAAADAAHETLRRARRATIPDAARTSSPVVSGRVVNAPAAAADAANEPRVALDNLSNVRRYRTSALKSMVRHLTCC